VSVGIIGPLGIRRAVHVRELLEVLFDERERLQSTGDVDEIGRLLVLLESPLDLRELGAVGEKLAVARNAAAISFDRQIIARDYFRAVLGLTDGNILPVFVSAEIGKREAAVGYLQRGLVPLRKRDAAQAGEQARKDDGSQNAFVRECANGWNACRGNLQRSAEEPLRPRSRPLPNRILGEGSGEVA